MWIYTQFSTKWHHKFLKNWATTRINSRNKSFRLQNFERKAERFKTLNAWPNSGCVKIPGYWKVLCTFVNLYCRLREFCCLPTDSGSRLLRSIFIRLLHFPDGCNLDTYCHKSHINFFVKWLLSCDVIGIYLSYVLFHEIHSYYYATGWR